MRIHLLEEDGETIHVVVVLGGQEFESVTGCRLERRRLMLFDTHFYGAEPNSLGVARLRALAQMLMEQVDVDELEIRGAIRATGAAPGRSPRPMRFRRR
jgi:hypothetical protein